MLIVQRCLPTKVCCCIPFELGIQIMFTLIILLRIAGIICGCFYGPYLYLVVTLGGLYLSGDFLILYSVFWKNGNGEGCDYNNQKVWILIWQIMNVLAIIGLIVAIGWYSYLGMWAMLHDPVHFAVYIIIIILTLFLIYQGFLLYALATYLRESYIDSVLGQKDMEEDNVGLTSGGRRVSI